MKKNGAKPHMVISDRTSARMTHYLIHPSRVTSHAAVLWRDSIAQRQYWETGWVYPNEKEGIDDQTEQDSDPLGDRRVARAENRITDFA